MVEKYFNINGNGYSIRCKAYCNKDLRSITSVVLCAHGFGGSKESASVRTFAEKALSKKKDLAVIAFDWPAHGEDARKRLTLEDCDTYLSAALAYCASPLGVQDVCLYATSMGGYLGLKYIQEHSNPFRRIVLRCPAVDMYRVIQPVITPALLEKLQAGKPVLVGFERKVEITQDFLDGLHRCDLMQMDFLELSESILILHGTKDETVPIGPVREFADNNLIEFIPVENADHMFKDPQIMAGAVAHALSFMNIGK